MTPPMYKMLLNNHGSRDITILYDPAIALSMFMLSLIFVVACGLFEWK